MALLKSKDFFLYKKGTTAPTAANAYYTDGNVSISASATTFDVDLVGDGKGNSKTSKEVKDSVGVTLSANLVLMEPTDIASGLPQAELLESAGFKQVIDTTNNKILLYPSLDAAAGTGVYYKGGVMKYTLNSLISSFNFTASAANTKVSASLEMQGTYVPADVSNEAGITPTPVENDFFRITKDSTVSVNGVAKCPFGDITLSLNSQINTGEDSRVCGEVVLEDIQPILSFSEVLDSTGDSNLVPITNWLNDADVSISFFLYSKNYKMEIRVNKGEEKMTEDGESGLRWLQKRNIRLNNDANGRAFEIEITPR